MRFFPILLLAAVAAPAVPAAAQTRDHAPTALPSSQRMRHDNARSESWTFIKPGLDLSRFQTLLIEPTAVYRGPDAQFGNISAADRTRFAGYLTDALRQELPEAMPLAQRAGPGTLRLKLTLIGAETTTGGVATASRVTPIGLGLSAVRSVTGHGGSFTGSVLFAIELTDAASGELLVAAVRRRSPDALDIPATLSTADTVRAVARDLAKHLRERLSHARRTS